MTFLWLSNDRHKSTVLCQTCEDRVLGAVLAQVELYRPLVDADLSIGTIRHCNFVSGVTVLEFEAKAIGSDLPNN